MSKLIESLDKSYRVNGNFYLVKSNITNNKSNQVEKLYFNIMRDNYNIEMSVNGFSKNKIHQLNIDIENLPQKDIGKSTIAKLLFLLLDDYQQVIKSLNKELESKLDSCSITSHTKSNIHEKLSSGVIRLFHFTDHRVVTRIK